MTQDDWVKWIRAELVQVASHKFPNDPRKQMIYSIGFLEAQLAANFRTDSRCYDTFKQAINRSSRR
jgi:hypothetical protein